MRDFINFLHCLPEIIRRYIIYRKHWEDLCRRCGQCCYDRYRGPDGRVKINRYDVCEHYDETTHLCKVYHERFQVCDSCAKVNLWTALFYRYLPDDCGYAVMFRFWKKLDLDEIQ